MRFHAPSHFKHDTRCRTCQHAVYKEQKLPWPELSYHQVKLNWHAPRTTEKTNRRNSATVQLPHLHTGLCSYLTGSVEAALKMAIFKNKLNTNISVIICVPIISHTNLIINYVIWSITSLTFRNSFLSTCSLPSTSSILKAIWNPVSGSATVMVNEKSQYFTFTPFAHTWVVIRVKCPVPRGPVGDGGLNKTHHWWTTTLPQPPTMWYMHKLSGLRWGQRQS